MCVCVCVCVRERESQLKVFFFFPCRHKMALEKHEEILYSYLFFRFFLANFFLFSYHAPKLIRQVSMVKSTVIVFLFFFFLFFLEREREGRLSVALFFFFYLLFF